MQPRGGAQERLKRSLWDEGQRVGGKKCKHFVVASVLFSRSWRSANTQPNARHDSELGGNQNQPLLTVEDDSI